MPAIDKVKNAFRIGWKRIVNRITLWKNAIIGAFNRGQVESPPVPGQPEKLLIWKIGATEKHCKDCKLFDGKVLTQSEWSRLPLPQSPDLECGGWHCDCSLTETDLPRTGISEIGL